MEFTVPSPFPPTPLLKRCGAPLFLPMRSRFQDQQQQNHGEPDDLSLTANVSDFERGWRWHLFRHLFNVSFFGECWAMSCSKFLGDCWKSPYQEPLMLPSLPLEKRIASTQEQFNDFTINEKKMKLPKLQLQETGGVHHCNIAGNVLSSSCLSMCGLAAQLWRWQVSRWKHSTNPRDLPLPQKELKMNMKTMQENTTHLPISKCVWMWLEGTIVYT